MYVITKMSNRRKMLKYIENNDLESFVELMEENSSDQILCTELLINSFQSNKIKICNYILKYMIRSDFDLDAELFQDFVDENKPFDEKQLKNLNLICSKLMICCISTY